MGGKVNSQGNTGQSLSKTSSDSSVDRFLSQNSSTGTGSKIVATVKGITYGIISKVKKSASGSTEKILPTNASCVSITEIKETIENLSKLSTAITLKPNSLKVLGGYDEGHMSDISDMSDMEWSDSGE